ncbi:hypothetical protein [Nitrobacter sp.]|uniref:hypothetical protein n=1 Tax=Nitrobacter sp. TaxID=29420 RepID=UPI00399D5A85
MQKRIRSLNRDLDEIVLTHRGRGGAILTTRGAELVERFYKIQRGIYDKFSSELAFAAHLAGGDKKGNKISPRDARWMEARAKLGACDDICIRSGVGMASR